MARARQEQVSLDTTPYYHCVSHCVRGAHLCGKDPQTGKNHNHRREWLQHRLETLPEVFAVDVCAYAVLSDHFHVVLRVNEKRAKGWSDEEVVERYGKYFPLAKSRWELLGARDKKKKVKEWRARLYDLGWMIRTVKENVARQANKEDGCRGRFWERRFVSQQLLDEGALVTAMTYVDLNPIRIGLEKSLRRSKHTSIAARLQTVSAYESAAKARKEGLKGKRVARVPEGLMPFEDQAPRGNDKKKNPIPTVPMSMEAYVGLLEWTARQVMGKARAREADPEVLADLRLNPESWIDTMANQGLRRLAVLGAMEHLEALAKNQGKKWVRGQSWSKRAYLDVD